MLARNKTDHTVSLYLGKKKCFFLTQVKEAFNISFITTDIFQNSCHCQQKPTQSLQHVKGLITDLCHRR